MTLIKKCALVGGLLMGCGMCRAQVAVPAQPALPNYFAETGLSYNYYGRTPASATGFGLRIGNSNAFSVTSITTTLGRNAATFATLETGLEYHVAASGQVEFLGFGAAGVTTDGNVTLGNFSGGFGLSYNLGKALTKGRVDLPVVGKVKMENITATQVKPTYEISFRKTF